MILPYHPAYKWIGSCPREDCPYCDLADAINEINDSYDPDFIIQSLRYAKAERRWYAATARIKIEEFINDLSPH